MRMICRRGLAVLVSLVIILTMIPGGAVYAADSLSNEAKVYNYLVSKMGLNTAAACGLLANIKAESDFNPVGDGDAGTSFGLFQWHAGRKTSLINYCESNGLDYRSIEGQMRYLEYELKKSYVSVYNYIKGVENTADGAYQAGYHWCYYYEIPADKAVKADRRGEMAKTVYWKKYEIYKGKTIKDESEMDPADYKVSFSRALEYGDEMMVGADVLYMQICLYCLGYSIDADGSYGPQSSGVVKRFQSAHGLEADGVCNKLTWNAIENELFSGTLKITRQPQAVTTEIGKKVTFSTRAAGSTPSYQWYHKKVGASVWTKWEGKSSATVSATSNESWNGMQVRCTVTDSSGATVNTKAVTVTVKIPLSITQQPQSVETAAGESVTFTIAAKGTGLTYQWYYKKADESEWVKWNGHTAASVSTTANERWNGMQVRCTVSDSSGGKADSEVAVVKIVNQNGTVQQLEITQHPQSVTAHVGDMVKFSVRAIGSGLSYQWYFRKEGADWTKWEGKTSPDISADANESWSGMQVRCMVADSSGYKENSDAATVTMDISLQITQQPQSVTAGVGETVEFAVKASGAGLSYQWYFRKEGASDWTKWIGHTSASTTATANENWNGMQVRCTVTDSKGGSVDSRIASVTLIIPLDITEHPQSVTVKAGDTVKFAVKASGVGLNYQWYVRKSGASDWTLWPGHTTASTSATANDSWNGMQVRCTVTDNIGGTAHSKAATVTINIPLAITQQPQSVTAEAGETVKFAVKASGEGLSYQWYFKKAGASDWTKWIGHTTASTSATSNESWNGMQVRCTVTDSKGSVLTSKAATVTINIPLAITRQPQSVTVKTGETAKFSVKAVGNGLSYQWYYKKVGASWTKWAGHTTASTSAVSNDSWNGMQVRCQVTDERGNTENSETATITVMIPLAVTQQPQSVTSYIGDTVKFAVKASGSGLSYQWYYRKSGASSWTKWSGHTTATTSAISNDSWNGMQVRCAVTDSNGSTIHSEAATVTLCYPLEITQQPQSVTANVGDTVKFAVKASGSGLSYQWYYRKSGASSWTKWPGHTTATTSSTANESWNGMQVRCTVTDSMGSKAQSNPATVTLNLPLAITQQPQSVTANAGDTVRFAVNANGVGLSYQWYYKKSGASAWSKWAGHTTAATSATANESWNGMQVRCTVTDESGSNVTSEVATVTVNVSFAITQHPQPVTAEIGDTVTFTVKASGNGLRYQWYFRKVGSMNWIKWEGHTTAVTSATANESWNGMKVMCIVTDDSGSRLNSGSAEVTLILG